MFDHDNSSAIWRGSAIQNSALARHNAGVARAAKQRAAYAEDVAVHNGEAARNWRERADQLEARIAQLEYELAMEKADAAGVRAYLDAFKAAHPTSPVLAPSGRTFRESGNIKTVGRLHYEAAFDATWRELRPEPPTDARVD